MKAFIKERTNHYLDKAQMASLEKNYLEARTEAQKILALAPGHAEGLRVLDKLDSQAHRFYLDGYVWYVKKDLKETKLHWNKALKLLPDPHPLRDKINKYLSAAP